MPDQAVTVKQMSRQKNSLIIYFSSLSREILKDKVKKERNKERKNSNLERDGM